jgi:hypothetical protein
MKTVFGQRHGSADEFLARIARDFTERLIYFENRAIFRFDQNTDRGELVQRPVDVFPLLAGAFSFNPTGRVLSSRLFSGSQLNRLLDAPPLQISPIAAQNFASSLASIEKAVDFARELKKIRPLSLIEARGWAPSARASRMASHRWRSRRRISASATARSPRPPSPKKITRKKLSAGPYPTLHRIIVHPASANTPQSTIKSANKRRRVQRLSMLESDSGL